MDVPDSQPRSVGRKRPTFDRLPDSLVSSPRKPKRARLSPVHELFDFETAVAGLEGAHDEDDADSGRGADSRLQAVQGWVDVPPSRTPSPEPDRRARIARLTSIDPRTGQILLHQLDCLSAMRRFPTVDTILEPPKRSPLQPGRVACSRSRVQPDGIEPSQSTRVVDDSQQPRVPKPSVSFALTSQGLLTPSSTPPKPSRQLDNAHMGPPPSLRSQGSASLAFTARAGPSRQSAMWSGSQGDGDGAGKSAREARANTSDLFDMYCRSTPAP